MPIVLAPLMYFIGAALHQSLSLSSQFSDSNLGSTQMSFPTPCSNAFIHSLPLPSMMFGHSPHSIFFIPFLPLPFPFRFFGHSESGLLNLYHNTTSSLQSLFPWWINLVQLKLLSSVPQRPCTLIGSEMIWPLSEWTVVTCEEGLDFSFHRAWEDN